MCWLLKQSREYGKYTVLCNGVGSQLEILKNLDRGQRISVI